MTKIALVSVVSLLLVACGGSANDLLGGAPRQNHPMDGDTAATDPADPGADGTTNPLDTADASGTPAADGGTEAGVPPTDAAVPVFAFDGAGAYVATTGKNTQKGDHPNGGNPAKADCMTSSCHGPGGEGPRFAAGGSVFKDVAGTMPAAQVEVRFLDADGTAVSTYTDALGNFFITAGAAQNLSFPMKTGARDGTATRNMSGSIASGACNSAGCHGGTTGVIHVP